MANPPASNPAYTQVIDLTSSATRKRKQAEAKERLQSESSELDPLPVSDLPERVQAAVAAIGWPSLMPVQQQAMPYLLEGRDLIVQSRTGSGKTGGFLLPLFERLDPDLRAAQALIMTPTRELARQIHDEFQRMRGDSPLDSALIYGGVKYQPQIKAIKDGIPVLIGTPGRLLDHLERRTLSLEHLKVLILDEADEMLSMGFYPSMRRLKGYLPSKARQSMMFSATMPPKVQALSREFLTEPDFISLSAGNETVDAIDYRYYVVPPMEKDRALARIIEMDNPDSAIIFANTKREVEYVTRFLQNFGHDADAITGDLNQRARERVMKRIRTGQLRFMVATDVAARGIDISDLSHVFMYDVPNDQENFVHRSGRTARAGKSGTAIILITPTERNTLIRIGLKFDADLMEHDLPTEDDVTERIGERLTVMLEDKLRDKSNLEKERLDRFTPLIQELTNETPELLALLLDELYHASMHAPENPDEPSALDDKVEPRQKSRPRSRSRGRGRGKKGGDKKSDD
ncbi:MAG: DEAD/DEAH box helicase [Bacteroidota bacterium]